MESKREQADDSTLREAMPRRFLSLDALRGVAALAVVFWHWQHFFYIGTARGGFEKVRQPFYGVFFVFYEKGWMMVDLFFSLSGFIFFWLYSDRIATRQIGASEFSVLRLSRLYPLHLVTLLFVAVVQWNLWNRTGDFFIYSLNDVYHFFLNVFFISSWGLESGDSFNAPVWSVSVEIFLYATFFALCRAVRPRWLYLVALALVGGLLKFYTPLGRGIYSFFLGGIAYYVYAVLFARGLVRTAIKPLAFVVLLGWAAFTLESKFGIRRSNQPASIDSLYVDRGVNLLVTGVLMPMTILLLAASETVKEGIGKSVSFLGDISYSSYLVHFPLQLALFSITGALGTDSAFYYSELTLIGFFLVLMVLSLLSYHYLERPVQGMIRKRLHRAAWRRSPVELETPDALPPAARSDLPARNGLGRLRTLRETR